MSWDGDPVNAAIFAKKATTPVDISKKKSLKKSHHRPMPIMFEYLSCMECMIYDYLFVFVFSVSMYVILILSGGSRKTTLTWLCCSSHFHKYINICC